MPIMGKDAGIIIMDDPHAVGDVVPRETVIGWFKGEVPRPIDPALIWCPGCSGYVKGICHHFNCAIGPHGLQAQIDAKTKG